MSKETFNIDFRSGSLREKHSNALGVNVGNQITKQEKGLAYSARQANSGQITYPAADMTALNFGTGAFTIACAFKMGKFVNIGSGINFLFFNGWYANGIGGIGIGYGSDQEITLHMDNGVDTQNLILDDFDSLYDGKYHLIIFTFDGTTYKGYLDNVKETTELTNTLNITTLEDFYVSRDAIAGRRSNSDVAYIRAYNDELTSTERNELMEEFLHSNILHETKYDPSPVLKQTDLSKETGVVAAYNFTEGQGDTDNSVNHNNGTLSGGSLLSPRGRIFDGVDDKEVLGNLGNVKSVSFRIKLATTTEQILEGAANDKLILANAGTLTYAEFDNAYINGIDSDTISAGLWHNVVITSSTDVDMSACTLALNNTSYGAFDIADLNFYNYELTPTQAKAYHNSFQEVYFKDNMTYDGADGIVGTKDPFITGTGDFKTEELATADSVLTDLKVGTKYLECDSAGTTAVQSKQAYGEWEFDVYKGAEGNNIWIDFIQNSSNIDDGYIIRLYDSEIFAFQRRNNGSSLNLFYTATSYIDIDTWYRLKVARLSSEGVFPDIPTLQTSDLVNGVGVNAYTTFTSNGRYGYSATSDGNASHIAGTADEISIVNTEKYLVEFDMVLNSGTAPTINLRTSLTGTIASNSVIAFSGRNSYVLTATDTDTGVLRFFNASSATDYTVSGLTIERIYDANTFATFIKGGDFGDTNWTLVDPTGGSGSNPILDSTYTTSNYFVADLDDGDRLANIKMKNIVEQ